jgi:hypothetical protein
MDMRRQERQPGRGLAPSAGPQAEKLPPPGPPDMPTVTGPQPADGVPAGGEPSGHGARGRGSKERPLLRATRKWGLYGLAGAVALALAVALFNAGGSTQADGERGSPNHDKVARVTEKNKGGESVVGFEELGGGSLTFVPGIKLQDADRDPATTAAVTRALEAGDVRAADKALQAAQNVPELKVDPEKNKNPAPVPAPRLPVLTPGLRAQVRAGDVEFFHLFVYDCCAEDGDVIEVLVNGESYAVIPLTHRGATLSIPVPRDGNVPVQIRGVRDGEGGGITLGCRTSRGTFYLRSMLEGEILNLGLVRP